MLCVGDARIGPVPQRWWAVASRDSRCASGRRGGGVRSTARAVRVDGGDVEIALELDEGDGVESVNAHGGAFVWTRKQAGVPARGTVEIDGRDVEVDGAGGRRRDAPATTRATRRGSGAPASGALPTGAASAGTS